MEITNHKANCKEVLTQDFFPLSTYFEMVSFLPLSLFARIFPLASLWSIYFLECCAFSYNLWTQTKSAAHSNLKCHSLSCCHITCHITQPVIWKHQVMDRCHLLTPTEPLQGGCLLSPSPLAHWCASTAACVNPSSPNPGKSSRIFVNS